MKANVIRPSRYVSYRRNCYTHYPNAASRRNFAERLVNTVLAAAVTVALVVIMMFLMALA